MLKTIKNINWDYREHNFFYLKICLESPLIALDALSPSNSDDVIQLSINNNFSKYQTEYLYFIKS